MEVEVEEESKPLMHLIYTVPQCAVHVEMQLYMHMQNYGVAQLYSTAKELHHTVQWENFGGVDINFDGYLFWPSLIFLVKLWQQSQMPNAHVTLPTPTPTIPLWGGGGTAYLWSKQLRPQEWVRLLHAGAIFLLAVANVHPSSAVRSTHTPPSASAHTHFPLLQHMHTPPSAVRSTHTPPSASAHVHVPLLLQLNTIH